MEMASGLRGKPTHFDIQLPPLDQAAGANAGAEGGSRALGYSRFGFRAERIHRAAEVFYLKESIIIERSEAGMSQPSSRALRPGPGL